MKTYYKTEKGILTKITEEVVSLNDESTEIAKIEEQIKVNQEKLAVLKKYQSDKAEIKAIVK